MAKSIGRSTNVNDVATVTTHTVGAVNPVVIAPANPERIVLSVSLDSGASDQEVFVRLYPEADDNIKKGDLLVRRLSSNDALYNPPWRMETDNIYTGEISAISESGNVIIHVAEY